VKKWIAVLKGGEVVSEGDRPWSAIAAFVVGLSLHIDGVDYNLPQGMDSYIQGKTMCAPMSGGTASVMSRYIGFRKDGNEYRFRVDEDKPECRIEIN